MSTTRSALRRKTFSWTFIFKVSENGNEVRTGVFAPEFIKARTKALGQLVE